MLASFRFLHSLNRKILAHTLTLNTINPKITPNPTRPMGDFNLPIDIIKAASYECHEDAPRWWKGGFDISIEHMHILVSLQALKGSSSLSCFS